MAKQFVSEVLEMKHVGDSVAICKLSIPKDFYFKPGQYILVAAKDSKGRKISRNYSISSPKNNDFIELCVKKVEDGPVSNYIYNLKPGDKVEVLGPAGKFFINETPKDKHLCFVCNGTGIGPFVPMIHELLERNFKGRIILIKGFRNEEEILYEQEFNLLKKRFSNFRHYNILSQPNESREMQGYVQDFLERLDVLNKSYHFYICGLTGMIESVVKKLKEAEIPEEGIFYENYDDV